MRSNTVIVAIVYALLIAMSLTFAHKVHFVVLAQLYCTCYGSLFLATLLVQGTLL